MMSLLIIETISIKVICDTSQLKVPYAGHAYFEILGKIALLNIDKIIRKIYYLFLIFSRVAVNFV